MLDKLKALPLTVGDGVFSVISILFFSIFFINVDFDI